MGQSKFEEDLSKEETKSCLGKRRAETSSSAEMRTEKVAIETKGLIASKGTRGTEIARAGRTPKAVRRTVMTTA